MKKLLLLIVFLSSCAQIKSLIHQNKQQKSVMSERVRVPASFPQNSLNPNNYTQHYIAVGMSKNDVLRIWGKPSRIDIAGHPSHQNGRWFFERDGMMKYVFFEGGRVHGWYQN